jgi:hypothetical protein
MKKNKLWICYYYEGNGEANSFLFVSENGTKREAEKYINNEFNGNIDKNFDWGVYPVDKESDIKGNEYEIIVGKRVK